MPSLATRTDPDVDGLDILGTFFEVSLDLLVVRELDGRVVRASPSWETVLGHRPDEMEGQPLLRLLHPDDQTATQASVVEVENRGPTDPVTGFINRYRHKNGEYRTLEWRARRAGDRVYGVARDVTDRVAADRELLEAKAREIYERSRYLSGKYATFSKLMADPFLARCMRFTASRLIGYSKKTRGH